MSDASFRIAELLLQGDNCGHVLAKLALEARGEENPGLVRALSALARGMERGFNCGSLTGGCCVLGLYAGRSEDSEKPHPLFEEMVEQYARWFQAEMTSRYGGMNCADIIHFDPALKQQRCPGVILDCWSKIQEILERFRIDVEGSAPWRDD